MRRGVRKQPKKEMLRVLKIAENEFVWMQPEKATDWARIYLLKGMSGKRQYVKGLERSFKQAIPAEVYETRKSLGNNLRMNKTYL